MQKDRLNGYIKGKYYIDGKEIPIKDDVKKIFEDSKREEEKLRKRDSRAGLFLFQDIDTNERLFMDILQDTKCDIEEEIIEKEFKEEIRIILSSLNKDELHLLKLLIEKELTEREISKIIGVSNSTLNYRKKKLLNKLKKLFNNLISFVI